MKLTSSDFKDMDRIPNRFTCDFRQDVTELNVPVYVVQGKYDMDPRADLVPGWFDALKAPTKEMVVLQHSGHNPYMSEFARFYDFMTNTVLEETYPGDGPR